MQIFKDRQEAGRKLGESLNKYQSENPIVLSIPRGGVVTGFEVAKLLKAPLDMIIVRKVGVPSQPELGMGAVAEGNIEILDKDMIKSLRIPKDLVDEVVLKEKAEIERRKNLYRYNKPIIDVKDRFVILVDDGLATGISARAAIESLKKLKPKKIIFAAPVCAKESVKSMKNLVDEVYCMLTPSGFSAVGNWYQNFDQVADEEVKEMLRNSLSF